MQWLVNYNLTKLSKTNKRQQNNSELNASLSSILVKHSQLFRSSPSGRADAVPIQG